MSKLLFKLAEEGAGSGGFSWLPREAAGRYLPAVATDMQEKEHDFADGKRQFLELALIVKWNGIKYQQRATIWSNNQAQRLMQAIGVKELSVDTKEVFGKPFIVVFRPNPKGFLKATDILKRGEVEEGSMATPPQNGSQTPKPQTPIIDDEVPF